MSRIPLQEASQLTNRTVPIPDDPGYYVVTIDVFHELHCLNMMRKRIFWNSTQGEMPDMYSLHHMDHCIDSLRQSLMCSSDITPIPYAWYPKYNQVLPTTGVPHTCRDFDAIREWAKERYTDQMELKVRMDDPLGNVVHAS
ncbi:hypothetical protein BU23DRAFT_577611 [Bimuria novae-zelandiae CBS 107.79]|uniref:Tat pathway signal sequence n=1 Tax=Bimuria novae-zelandiae CBS 107.79 TaxID=1447943 RepID=A0A6A5VLN8_9PLEO|nr:hypothetical protein BU23DRAFT_577611 [Bimuria novae-zelandiae CBS 107.79]